MTSYHLKKVDIPDSWSDVQEFCDWYIKNDMPIHFGIDTEIYCSDDATSVCLFRKNNFQVELYLVHANPLVNIHEHPNVEVIKLAIEDGIGRASEILKMGMSHGVGARASDKKKGFPLLAFQHWKKSTPSTVAAAWKGKTVGPKHEALIKRFYPHSLVLNGYADITKPSNYLEVLKNGTNP